MRLPRRSLAHLVCLLCGFGASVQADPGPETPRLDRLGKPLPPHAVCRIGADDYANDTFESHCTVSPDGVFAAYVSNKEIHVWDAQTGRSLRTLQCATVITAIAFSSHGNVLAASEQGGGVALYNARTGAMLRRVDTGSDTRGAATFSSDGSTLASAAHSNEQPLSVYVCDARTGLLLCRITTPHFDRFGFDLSPDGRRLVSWGVPWVNHRKPRNPLPNEGPSLLVWDTATGEELLRLQPKSDPLAGAAFSPDGRRLAAVSEKATLQIWDADSGRLLHQLQGKSGVDSFLAWLPNGQSLVAGSREGVVQRWRTDTGERLELPKAPISQMFALAVRPSGEVVAFGETNKGRLCWNVLTGKPLGPLVGPVRGAVTFSRDDRQLYTAGGGTGGRRWHPLTGGVGGIAGGRTARSRAAVCRRIQCPLLAARHLPGLHG